jgi:hypothetical protein
MDALRYTGDEAALRAALAATTAQDLGRTFSLRQIRENRGAGTRARDRAGRDHLRHGLRRHPSRPGAGARRARPHHGALIDENPAEVFSGRGPHGRGGDARYNLALSDRRAETVALALTEYFDVPPENLVVQGYGEATSRIPTSGRT